MYKKCPKCAAESAGLQVCPACGLIFAKYLKTRFAVAQPSALASRPMEDENRPWTRAKGLLFHIPEQVDAIVVYGRAVLLAAIAFYGVRLALMDIASWEMSASLIHLPMIPIHEFGHVLFSPLGEFMMLLGGSLFQIGLPLIFGGIFLVKNRDPFAASVMLWWSAVALMDIAPYIYDAKLPQHILLTGRTGDSGAHDFIDVLGDLGLLDQAQPIGRGAHAFGILMLLAALGWGAWLVWQQHRRKPSGF